MRERESEGNHGEDFKKNKKIQTTIFVILPLHCYGKTPGKKTIVNPKREKVIARKEEGRRSAPETSFSFLCSFSNGNESSLRWAHIFFD